MSNSILSALLAQWKLDPQGTEEDFFRTAYPNNQKEIDSLIFRGRIRRRNGRLVIDPVGLDDLAAVDKLGKELQELCSRVFHEAREFAIKNRKTPIPVMQLAWLCGVDVAQLMIVLPLMLETGIWGTHSNDLALGNASLTPSIPGILQHTNYADLVSEARKVADASSAAVVSMHSEAPIRLGAAHKAESYVNGARLEELRAIKGASFDLSRLVRLCEELNVARDNESWMTCAILARAIVDHVPPIFECPTFALVANNIGGKSFKHQMQRLDTSLRKVADAHLHLQVRERESLPNFSQVDFRSDIDVLLSEVVRRLK